MVDFLSSFNAIVKMCTGCRKEKSISHFHLKGADKAGNARYQSICKDCANARRTERYIKKTSKAKAS